jgi:hypothetical protein
MSQTNTTASEPSARTHAEAAALFRRPFAPGAIGFRAMTARSVAAPRPVAVLAEAAASCRPLPAHGTASGWTAQPAARPRAVAGLQDTGPRLAAEGFEGVMFRSSARPAGLCVCVFASAEGFAGVQPVGSPERIIVAPVPPRGMRT